MSDQVFHIKPAGRHLLTIGRDLIQDPYAAIVELVKNAYDADANSIAISFEQINEEIKIIVEDDGHGMTKEVVTEKWLVPSTDDKVKRKLSPKGRIMQGRKGIGRYAASILGNQLSLETVSNIDGEKTCLSLNWDDFEGAQFLEDVNIIIKTEKQNQAQGTKLVITGNYQYLQEWDTEQFDILVKELKKLMPPISNEVKNTDSFTIKINKEKFRNSEDFSYEIEPFPLFELYDYRISGKIDTNGNGTLIYNMQKAKNSVSENISFEHKVLAACGNLEFDIRVFDREPDAIQSLINRGLKDDNGNYIGKLEARRLLNENNGIGVYRNGFRIRPLGDANFDWLRLNESRVQNPSMKIGLNQVIGIVKIESEEISNLVEKSARDGLRENKAYFELVKIVQEVIVKLETKRFEYRVKAEISRKKPKIQDQFQKLFSFDPLISKIKTTLSKSNVGDETTADIINVIKETENEKNKIAEELKELVAIYQGQATLGKIINVVIHEGRKSLSYFKNHISLFKTYYTDYKKGNTEKLPAIYEKVQGFATNSEMLSKLFSKIDPLAMGRRGRKNKIFLQDEIKNIFSIFTLELSDMRFSVETTSGSDIEFECWKQDLYSIFTNLIENSIFWINESSSVKKTITVIINTDNGILNFIDYRDSGTGIEDSLIESEIIFEPHFSTKLGGTGLGLSIAGECAQRCGFILKALSSNSGAYFRLEKSEVVE